MNPSLEVELVDVLLVEVELLLLDEEVKPTLELELLELDSNGELLLELDVNPSLLDEEELSSISPLIK